MDFTAFIDSRDIREYLKSTGYTFTSLEAAWAVFNCKEASVTERHRAYGYITDNMPDCRVTDIPSGTDLSLHEVLRTVIRVESSRINRIYDNSDSVYLLAERHRGDDYWNEDYQRAYKSYESCIGEARNILQSGENSVDRKNNDVRFMIHKLGTSSNDKAMTAWLNDDLEIKMIYPPSDNELKYDECIALSVLYTVKAELPHPFVKGDLLGRFDGDFYPYTEDPVIFDGALSKEEAEQNHIAFPMTARCISDSGNGKTCMIRYTHLEYYDRYTVC